MVEGGVDELLASEDGVDMWADMTGGTGAGAGGGWGRPWLQLHRNVHVQDEAVTRVSDIRPVVLCRKVSKQ